MTKGNAQIPPIVGIGASAGGLDAFTQLLENLPIDTGMAFVLIQHLEPTRKSLLTEILARKTQMSVTEVENGMLILANQVYIMPPNKEMIIYQNDTLKLIPREKVHGRYLPIDKFFNSLAKERGNKAIAVVLSGADGDGALGLAEVKEAGGITFAQNISSSKFQGMPHHAIATGCVDFILPPEAIAQELVKISRHPYINLPTEVKILPSSDNILSQIFALLWEAKEVDFTGYKPATIERRIGRRMALHNLASLEDYLQYIRINPKEIEYLYQDLLINVTSFFRDPEAFHALKNQVFPAIFLEKSSELPIRIWVAGCSTGEETYSIAICLLEFLEQQGIKLPIQIFATDINELAIAQARTGMYKPSLMANVSPERLGKFFIEVEGGYKIKKSLRELCIFAIQNLNSDPPFSQLDLISCRNVLIYLGASRQKRLIPIFHYALLPTGFLMLGASETVGEFSYLFTPIDKKQKIYTRQQASIRLKFDFSPRTLEKVNPIMPTNKDDSQELDLLQEADRIVLKRYAPVGVIINNDMDILQFRGQTGTYLEPASGRASFNLLKMAKEGLLLELRNAIHQAKDQHEIVRKEGIQVKLGEEIRAVNLEVIPLNTLPEKHFLVLFDENIAPFKQQQIDKNVPIIKREETEVEKENVRLRQELAATREYLQSIIEEQESTNQSLQVANEEILSSNEELQSTIEELETTQEELQASNEELHTINEEMRSRNQELNGLNNDLYNLLSSINIPIIMLDGELRIRRYTPQAQGIFNIIPTDVGRPFSDIQPKIFIPRLRELIEEVIDTLVVKEQEVQDGKNHWYSLRIRPYRTTENQIDGVVMGLIDIDALKQTAIMLEEARDYANAIVETVRQPLIVLDENLRVIQANGGFYELFDTINLWQNPDQPHPNPPLVKGREPGKQVFPPLTEPGKQVFPPLTKGGLGGVNTTLARGLITEPQLIFELGNGEWNIPELRSLLEDILANNTEFENLEIVQITPAQEQRILLLNGRRIVQGTHIVTILLAIENITEYRQAEQQIRNSLREKEILLREIHHRVKNNLQIVSSLLSLQSNRLKNQNLSEVLQESQNRVRAMALIHETLHQSSNWAEVNFAEYTGNLVSNLFRTYPIESNDISFNLNVQPEIFINADRAVLCGLIINELVTNALKHGFPEGGKGELFVTLTTSEDNLLNLIIGNTGLSLSAEFYLENLSSMGLNLVMSLIKQLKGNLEVERGEITSFKIIFSPSV